MAKVVAALVALALAALGGVAYMRGRASRPPPGPAREAGKTLVEQAEQLAAAGVRAAELEARAKLAAAERKAKSDAEANARRSGGLVPYLRDRIRAANARDR